MLSIPASAVSYGDSARLNVSEQVEARLTHKGDQTIKMRIVWIMSASLVLPARVEPVQAVEVAVELENLAPHGGVFLSPV